MTSVAQADAQAGLEPTITLAVTTTGTPAAKATRANLSVAENVAVGIVGGVTEVSLQMPILTAKFCKQEARPLPTSMGGFYRGLGVQATCMAPLIAVQMALNQVIENQLTGGTRGVTDPERILCGVGAGAVSSAIYAPMDMVMIQQQRMGLGPGATVQALVRTYGASSIFRGTLSCALREAMYVSGYLGLAPVLTAKLMQKEGWEESYLAAGLAGSCTAGVVSSLATHPVDTLKTVYQAEIKSGKYTSATHATRELMASGDVKQGIQFLFRGGLFRTIRTCGAFFVISTLREQAIQYKSAQQ